MSQRRDCRTGLCAGHGAAIIIRLTKYPKSTVHDVLNLLRRSGGTKRKAHKKPRDRICSPTFLAGLKRSIMANPRTSMSMHAKKHSVCRAMISNAVKEFGLTSYSCGKRHLMTKKMKETRYKRCIKILNDLKGPAAGHLKFFSDEKTVTVDRSANVRNYRSGQIPGSSYF